MKTNQNKTVKEIRFSITDDGAPFSLSHNLIYCKGMLPLRINYLAEAKKISVYIPETLDSTCYVIGDAALFKVKSIVVKSKGAFESAFNTAKKSKVTTYECVVTLSPVADLPQSTLRFPYRDHTLFCTKLGAIVEFDNALHDNKTAHFQQAYRDLEYSYDVFESAQADAPQAGASYSVEIGYKAGKGYMGFRWIVPNLQFFLESSSKPSDNAAKPEASKNRKGNG
jgi:hypothetical protein